MPGYEVRHRSLSCTHFAGSGLYFATYGKSLAIKREGVFFEC